MMTKQMNDETSSSIGFRKETITIDAPDGYEFDNLTFPMPPAEASNPGPHAPSADIGPEVPERG